MSNPNTLLVISQMGVPVYSARGLTQTLQPIQQASNPVRTANGALIDITASQFRKYASTISCSDQEPPSVDKIFSGAEVTVQCVAELSFPTPIGESESEINSDSESPTASESESEFGRPPVQGSIRQSEGFTIYRPILQMVVLAFNIQKDEWGAIISWSITLEEK